MMNSLLLEDVEKFKEFCGNQIAVSNGERPRVTIDLNST